MSAYTLDEQIDEAVRELRMRIQVYPGWIARGSITAVLADRRIGLQQAIVRALTRQRDAVQMAMFGEEG